MSHSPRGATAVAALLLCASSDMAETGWVTNGPQLDQVNSVNAAPVSRLYAVGSAFATMESAVFESADGGESWESLIEAPRGDYFSEVFADPRDAQRLFAGVQTAGGNTNLYRSTN